MFDLLSNRLCNKPKNYDKSFIINDPSGELLAKYAYRLEALDYKIKVLNFANYAHSHAYNPFCYIREKDDVLKMVDVLLKYTNPILSCNGHWESVEHNLLSSLCLYLYYEAPQEEQNFSMVMELLRAAYTENSMQSDLDRLYKLLEDKNSDHIALQKYKAYKCEQSEYFSSGKSDKPRPKLSLRDRLLEATHQYDFVVNSIYKRIGIFNRRNIAAITIDDNIRLERFYNEKSALFITLPQNCERLRPILALLYLQIMDTMFGQDRNYGRLSLSLYFVDNYETVTFSADIIKSLYEISKKTNEIMQLITLMDISDFIKIFKHHGKQSDYSVENIKTPYDTLNAFFNEFK